MINLNNDMFLMNLQQASQKSSKVDEFRKVDSVPQKENRERILDTNPSDRKLERQEDKNFSNTLNNVKEERKTNKVDTGKSNDKAEKARPESVKAEKGDAEKTDNRTPAEKRSESINEANSESSKTTGKVEEKTVTSEKSDGKAEAVKMLVKSIEAISKKLDLNVSLSEGLDHIDLNNPSDAVIEQLSEIVFTLKEITSLLTTAVEENVALDMNGLVIEPQEAAELEKALRVELFRIELALSSLKLSGEVSHSVAEKQNKPAIGSGIPQAVDPSTLEMPQEQLKQILGDALEADEVKIESVLEKMKVLAKKESVKQVKSETNVTSSEVLSKDDSKKKSEVSGFDSQVMRRLLNVDKEAGQVVDKYEDKSAGETKIETATVHNTAHRQSPLKAFTLNTAGLELTNEGAKTGSESEGSFSVITGKSSIVMQNMRVAAASAPARNPEELVMSQVNQRFQYAVKNGVNEMRLALRPESLGKVDITIQMESDVVTARITVENQQVKQIIESNLQQLKNALAEQNLTAGSFDVNVNQGSKDQGEQADHAERGSGKISKTDGISSAVDAEDLEVTGRDTGRRFGSNTVEYFG